MSVFISEVSSNHHQDIERCFKFIDVSAEVGCSAVKFQLFKIDQLFAAEVLTHPKFQNKKRDWELPLEFIPELKRRCLERGVQFGCTPFYLDAVSELEPYVDFYKIASYELNWTELVRRCAKTKKPLVVSTGMSTFDEIDQTVQVAIDSGCMDLTVLHCVSGYPTPIDEANLAVLATYAERYQQKSIPIKFGWSDHSRSAAVLYRAIHKWNASMIEFHLDLDQQGEEYQTGHCWLPEEIKPVIDNIRLGFVADGSKEKGPSAIELAERPWRADPEDGLRPIKSYRNKLDSIFK